MYTFGNELNNKRHKTIYMNKFTSFVKESYLELVEQVSWPKWEQLQQSTMIVIGATLFITLIVGGMDFIASGSMKFIYSLFK
jgi:preprotein translocase subunit SecE